MGAPAILAVLLVLAGAALAVVAFRRGSIGAAVLILLLAVSAPLTLVASSSPASAATAGCPQTGSAGVTASPSPSASCTAATAVPDELLAPAASWDFFTDPTTVAWTGTLAAQYTATVTAITAIDPAAVLTSSLAPATENDPDFVATGPSVATTGPVSVTATEVSVAQTDFTEVQARDNAGAVVLTQLYTYSDGCSGTETTRIRIGANWSFPP